MRKPPTDWGKDLMLVVARDGIAPPRNSASVQSCGLWLKWALSPVRGSPSENIGARFGGNEMTLTRVVEVLIIVVMIVLAVRFFRKRA